MWRWRGYFCGFPAWGLPPVLGIAQGMQPILGYNYGAPALFPSPENHLACLWGSHFFVSSLSSGGASLSSPGFLAFLPGTFSFGESPGGFTDYLFGTPFRGVPGGGNHGVSGSRRGVGRLGALSGEADPLFSPPAPFLSPILGNCGDLGNFSCGGSFEHSPYRRASVSVSAYSSGRGPGVVRKGEG